MNLPSSPAILPMARQRRRTTLRALFFAMVALISLADAGRAAPVNVSDLVLAKQFATNVRPAVSPDGEWVAHTLTQKRVNDDVLPDMATSIRTGVPYPVLGGEIFLTSISTGETRQLTRGDSGSNWGPVWSPDGRFLAFLSDRPDGSGDTRTHVWVWERTTDRLRPLTGAAVRGAVQWTPDSRRVLARLLPPFHASETGTSNPVNPTVSPGPPGTTATVYRVQPTSELPVMLSTARLDAMRGGLALISVDDDRVQRLMENERVAMSSLSPDGQYVLIVMPREVARTGSFRLAYDLLALRPDAPDRTFVIASGVTLVTEDAVRWAPDSAKIVYKTPDGVFINSVPEGRLISQASHEFGWGIDRDNRTPAWVGNSNTVCYTTDNRVLWAFDTSASARQAASQPRKLAEFPESFVELIAADSTRVWSPVTDASIGIYVRSFATNQNGFYAVSLEDGSVTRLMETERSLGSANVPLGMGISRSDNSIVYLAESANEPPDLWIADQEFRKERRLTHANPQLDAIPFGRSRILSWRTEEGEVIHGALLLPPDHQPGTRYPLIVWVYGGLRQSRDANRFGFSRNAMYNMHLLATRGYAVFFPDAPQKFGEPVASLARNLLPGIERVVEEGYADPDRIGLAGQSYGGYSAVALLTQTTKFKAAIASAGVYNLTSTYLDLSPDGSSPGVGLADTGRFFIGGTLWENPEQFIANSPVMHLDKVSTPLLLLHGAADEATRATESEQVFVGLRRLGKPVEYVRYAGERHLISQSANQEDYWRRIVEWFDRYLKTPDVTRH